MFLFIYIYLFIYSYVLTYLFIHSWRNSTFVKNRFAYNSVKRRVLENVTAWIWIGIVSMRRWSIFQGSKNLQTKITRLKWGPISLWLSQLSPLDRRLWLTKLFFNFCRRQQKWFFVFKIHMVHLTTVVTSLIKIFCQRVSSVQVLTSFHIWESRS